MFNNRFNSSKNDPLVEAVKQAQAEGDLRRQAVAAVNEQFGVFSRNAVVREDLAAYDAAIEEAYKCMKEEEKQKKSEKEINAEKTKKTFPNVKHVTSKGHPDWEKHGIKDIPTVKEGKKLADKDYDKDGKIESPKDEVWGSRFRAAKAAGKMEEGSAVSGEDPGMEVAKKAGAAQQSQTPSSTPAPTKSKDLSSTFSSARGAAGMNEAQIDEISKELAGRYVKQADYKRSESSFRSGKVYGKELATKRRTKQDVEDSRKHNRDSFKREKGINMAVNKLTGRAKVSANEEVMKESIKAKLLAKHMKEDRQIDEIVVQPSQIKSGETLGQAMNRLQGKTAIKGGKNDISTPKPSSSSGPQNNPGLASAKGFPKTADKPIGDAGYKSGQTVSLKPIGDTGSAMAADNKPEPARPAPTPGWKSPAPVDQAKTIGASGGEAPMAAPKVAPTPPSRPANLGGSSAPAKPMQNPDQNITKVMKESVQVGVNKYRIV